MDTGNGRGRMCCVVYTSYKVRCWMEATRQIHVYYILNNKSVRCVYDMTNEDEGRARISILKELAPL